MQKIKYENGKEIAYDEVLLDNLASMKRSIKRDLDHCIVYSGPERSGKSAHAQQVALNLDPNFGIDNICFTAEQFLKRVQEAPQYSCVIFDEAMTGLSSREAMSKTNRMLIRALAEVGQRNLYIIVILPSFFMLDSYVALHRSRCLIHTWFGSGFARGYFSLFNGDRKRQLYLFGKKGHNMKAVKPNFSGRFYSGYTVDEEEYRRRKREALVSHTLLDDERSSVRLEESNRVGGLLTWLVEKKDLAYSEISSALTAYGLDLSDGALRKLVQRFRERNPPKTGGVV